MATAAAYPVRVEAELEPGLSRWLWLVKWILAVPHYVVLVFLWVAYVVLTVVAFFAILFTGRYPRSIFEFNVGVLRWSWRVSYYTFGANGTDRYPPFTLEEVPDYPAHLEIAYPERLSRGLVLVKWWLLAIPHYLVVALLIGGTTWFAVGHWGWPFAGLIGVLVVVAVVALAFTGRYPQGLFDLVLGLNRWVLRVSAYAGLMTDQYPPFRLDMGATEPGATLTIPARVPPAPVRPDVAHRRSGWTGGRITSLVIGAILVVTSVGLLGAGGFLLWADRTQRDAQGYLTTGSQEFTTGTYALTTQTTVGRDAGTRWLFVRGPGWFYGPGSSDNLRIRVTAADTATPVFVGIGPAADVARYLNGVAQARIVDFVHPAYRSSPGSAPETAPASQGFWAASSTGTGTQRIVWPVHEGDWTIVVMNARATQGVDVLADAGATIPILPWVATGVLVAGVVFLAGSLVLLIVPIRRAARVREPR